MQEFGWQRVKFYFYHRLQVYSKIYSDFYLMGQCIFEFTPRFMSTLGLLGLSRDEAPGAANRLLSDTFSRDSPPALQHHPPEAQPAHRAPDYN